MPKNPKITITSEMALQGAVCPVCGAFYKGNGVGPESSPKLSRTLSRLPSNHVMRYGAYFHDWAYHLGPIWGTRKEADQLMYDKNAEKIAELPWYSRWFYHLANKRNYWAVRTFGEDAYNKNGCKTLQ